MKPKLALSLAAAAFLTACAGTPTWDTSVFPSQPVYNAEPVLGQVVWTDPQSLVESRGE